MVNNLPANAEDREDVGSILGPGRSPGEANGNPPQYSFLGNLMDRGDRQTPVHRVTKSWTLRSTQTHVTTWLRHAGSSFLIRD